MVIQQPCRALDINCLAALLGSAGVSQQAGCYHVHNFRLANLRRVWFWETAVQGASPAMVNQQPCRALDTTAWLLCCKGLGASRLGASMCTTSDLPISGGYGSGKQPCRVPHLRW